LKYILQRRARRPTTKDDRWQKMRKDDDNVLDSDERRPTTKGGERQKTTNGDNTNDDDATRRDTTRRDRTRFSRRVVSRRVLSCRLASRLSHRVVSCHVVPFRVESGAVFVSGAVVFFARSLSETCSETIFKTVLSSFFFSHSNAMNGIQHRIQGG
jgi:hypothetical protein